MPTYFGILLHFERKDIYPMFMKDFYSSLENAGMKFKSGFWGFENDTLDKIVEWNQNLIENDFELGFTEHHSHDYKQAVFAYMDYSKVRGFWLNNYLCKNEFVFSLIVPESEVMEYNNFHFHFLCEKVENLIEISKKLWSDFPYIKMIQTECEVSSGEVSVKDIRIGKKPQVLPFAVVSESDVSVSRLQGLLNASDKSCGKRYEYQQIPRKGLLIIDNKDIVIQ